MKTMQISDENWSVLFKLKIDNKKTSLEEVIKDLLKKAKK